MKIINCQNEAEWLEQRRQGLGASDAAAILGASPWSSALSVWAKKLGLDDDVSDSEPMEWGHELEPVIAAKYARVTGRVLHDLGRYTILVDDERPWLRCTLDRMIGGDGVLEIKTAGAQFLRQWEDDGVPVHYMMQVQHQLAVTGYRWGAVAVLIGGQRFRHVDIQRDDALIAQILDAEEAFWTNHVLAQVPPPPDGTPATRELLARLYPQATPGRPPVVLPPDAAEWDRARVEASAEIDKWMARKTEAENRLKAAIGDAPAGLIPGGVVYAWTTQTRKAYSVAESSARVLRRKEPKA